MSVTVPDADYMRTDFLERVAHELRGPAGVTLSALDELETALGADAARFATLLAMARRGAKRVARVATRLEQTGQLEAHRARFARSPGDLAPLVEAGVRDAEALEARRQVALTLDVQGGPFMCEIDGKWLMVAVSEVTSNAIRHARARVSVHIERAEGAVIVVVSNDGAGVREFTPRRFAPTEARRGLGLSLAIVRDVMSAHEGSLVVETEGTQSETSAYSTRVRLLFPTAMSNLRSGDIEGGQGQTR